MSDSSTYVDQLFNEDCITGMARIPDGSVDLIVTDPPFGLALAAKKANYNRDQDNVVDEYAEVEPRRYRGFTFAWMTQAARVLAPGGSMFVFSGWNHLGDMEFAIDAVKLTRVNHIIWKYNFGLWTTRRFVSSHYHVYYLAKNNRKRTFNTECRFNKGDREGGSNNLYRDLEDVWSVPKEYWTGKLKTATRLPKAVVEKCIAYASNEGDLVLDPFVGSGQVPFIARHMGRHYCGFELMPKIYEFAKMRLDTNQYLIDVPEKKR